MRPKYLSDREEQLPDKIAYSDNGPQSDPLAQFARTQEGQTTTTETKKISVTIKPPREVNVILAIMSAFWNWFDERDVEKHLVALSTLILTYKILNWSMGYAASETVRSGTEIAAVLASINVPMAGLQAAVINFYFKARTSS
jgi:hypothetical protein